MWTYIHSSSNFVKPRPGNLVFPLHTSHNISNPSALLGLFSAINHVPHRPLFPMFYFSNHYSIPTDGANRPRSTPCKILSTLPSNLRLSPYVCPKFFTIYIYTYITKNLFHTEFFLKIESTIYINISKWKVGGRHIHNFLFLNSRNLTLIIWKNKITFSVIIINYVIYYILYQESIFFKYS